MSIPIDEEVSELKAVVHGIILGMEVPFKLPNDDGCVDSGLECPLAGGNEYRYSTTLPVLKQYPKVKFACVKSFRTIIEFVPFVGFRRSQVGAQSRRQGRGLRKNSRQNSVNL